MKKISFRLDNLELRNCVTINNLKMIQWIKEKPRPMCIVIACWDMNSEGYSLRYIQDRPFELTVNPDDFCMLARLGQAFLDEQFEDNKNNA